MNEIIIDSVTSSIINFIRNPNAKVNSSGGPFWAHGTEAFETKNAVLKDPLFEEHVDKNSFHRKPLH